MTLSEVNFQGRWLRAIKQGAAAWTELTKLYLWSKTRLPEIQRNFPEYTLEMARTMVRRVYNADPEKLLSVACKLGGGESREQMEKGRKLVERVGVYEAMRAELNVPESEWKTLAARAHSFHGPDDMAAATNQIIKETKAAAARLHAVPSKTDSEKPAPPPAAQSNLLIENRRLRKENAALKAENAALKARLGKIQALFGEVA